MEKKHGFSGIYTEQQKEYDGTTTSDIQRWKNMTMMEKVDTSDLIIMIKMNYKYINCFEGDKLLF